MSRRQRRRTGVDCSCCRGWDFYPKICERVACRALIHKPDDNWVRFDVMHDARVGLGTVIACSIECALMLLAEVRGEQQSRTPLVAYRGEGAVRLPGCEFMGHYAELQAYCDALGFAAQKMMADALDKQRQAYEDCGRSIAEHAHVHGLERARDAIRLGQRAQYLYGMFQGVRGLLRAVEGNTGELEPLEQEMLQRIDWSADVVHFAVPGFEHVKLEDQHLPGEEPVGSAQTQADG